MAIEHTTASLLIDLLRELSSELDLHYEDDELPAAASTMAVMQRAANVLERNGFTAPDSYQHILGRFAGGRRQ